MVSDSVTITDPIALSMFCPSETILPSDGILFRAVKCLSYSKKLPYLSKRFKYDETVSVQFSHTVIEVIKLQIIFTYYCEQSEHHVTKFIGKFLVYLSFS